jgi:hypothetical protein
MRQFSAGLCSPTERSSTAPLRSRRRRPPVVTAAEVFIHSVPPTGRLLQTLGSNPSGGGREKADGIHWQPRKTGGSTRSFARLGANHGVEGGDLGRRARVRRRPVRLVRRGGDCSDPATPCVKKRCDCSSGNAKCLVTANAADGMSYGAGLCRNAGPRAPATHCLTKLRDETARRKLSSLGSTAVIPMDHRGLPLGARP